MGVMIVSDNQSSSNRSALDTDGGQSILDQEKANPVAETDVYRVLQSKDMVDRRIIRIFKSKTSKNFRDFDQEFIRQLTARKDEKP